MTDPALILETLNGAAIVPGVICTILFTRYMVKETHRRGLRGLDWFHLPPSMDLILAMFLFNSAVLGERVVKWIWRRFFGADDVNAGEAAGMILFGSVIIIASLCKIRALTRPDYGNGPWLVSVAATIGAIAALILTR